MGKRIIVAGGGHGGIAAAAQIAKKGFDVTVYEAHERADMGYDWTDIFDPKAFDVIGLGQPDKKDFNFKHDMTFYSPSQKCRLKQHVPQDQLEIQMERKVIYDYLIDYAEKSGVKFNYGVNVLAPIMLGNRVVGIKTDKGDEYADLVIDACGANSPVRSNLPEYIGITREAGKFEKFYVYRAFFERTADIPEDDFNVLLLHQGKLGISWVAIEEEHTDVLIGRFEPFDMDEVESTLEVLRTQFPALGERKVRGGSFVTIPVRQALPKMITDGYAAIGDSAFMTVPLIGSGIANSLKASVILADTVAKDKNSEFSAKTLYPYQKNFFKKLGSGLAPIACIKLMLTKISTEDVDYLFDAGFLNDDDITMGADATNVASFLKGVNIPALKIKAEALIKDKTLLKKLMGTVKQLAAVVAVTTAIPPVYNGDVIGAWVKKYDESFK